MAKETRNTLLYLLGILVAIGLLLFVIVQFGNTGFGFFNTADKTYSQVPEKVLVDGKNYQAIIKTNFGNIKLDLFEANAPTTVNNFVFLSRDNFYDKTKIHRVDRDFVIQLGSRLTLDNDPDNDSLGGPGYRFSNEINWDSLGLSADQKAQLTQEGFKSDSTVQSIPLDKYIVAMANAGPDTNGSQFFITTATKDNDSIKAIEGKHTVFARVIEGMDVVDRINEVEVRNSASSQPHPVIDIVINDIEILEL